MQAPTTAASTSYDDSTARSSVSPPPTVTTTSCTTGTIGGFNSSTAVTETSQSRSDPLEINFEKLRSPDYAFLKVRINTFDGWPNYSDQKFSNLATAGFFYTGYGDLTRCFHCDVGLRNWEPEDDPWVEHARWFPNCAFLRQNKGESYVRMVQTGLLEEEDSNQPIQLPGEPSVLERGISEFKRTFKKLKSILNIMGFEEILEDERKDSVLNDRVKTWISVIYQKEKNCTMCKVQGHAIGYCSDCPGLIDEICMLFHEKIKKYGNHRVADYRLVPSKFCNEHRNLKMDLYCANCYDLICPLCVEEHTKQGHNVDYANDLFLVLNSIHKTKSLIEEILAYLPVSNSDERAVLQASIGCIDSTFGIVSNYEISFPGAMNTELETLPSDNTGNMRGVSTAKTSLYRTFSFGAILGELTTIQRNLQTYLITNRQVFKSNARTRDETYPKVAGNDTECQQRNNQNVMRVSCSGETFVTCQQQEEPILSETFGPITMAHLSFQTSDLFQSLQHPEGSEHGEKNPEQEIAALQGDLDNQINLDSFENLHPPQ